MGKLRKILIHCLSMILLSNFVLCVGVEKQGAERRADQDSYIDALHKTHAEDSLHCECDLVNLVSFSFYFGLDFNLSCYLSAW